MSLAEDAKLAIVMSMADRTQHAVRSVKGGLAGIASQTKRTQSAVKKLPGLIGGALKAGALVGVAGIALLVKEVKSGFDSLNELEAVTKATNAVLKSTGYAAHISAPQVRSMANELEDLTTIDDKVVQGAENVLLRFKGINKTNFRAATLASLDLATAMHTGPEAAALAVGRALDDPAKGIAKLTRLGVTFTDKEKKKIAQLLKSNDLLGAQNLIMKKLNNKFGGQAAAQADTFAGKQRKLADAFEDLKIALAGRLVGPLGHVVDKVTALARSKGAADFVKNLGDRLADLISDDNLKKGGETLSKVFDALKGLPYDEIKQGLALSGQVAKEAFSAFQSLDPDMKKIIIGALAANKLTGGLVSAVVQDVAGIALKSLTSIVAGNISVTGANVNVSGGGVGSGPGVPPGSKGGGIIDKAKTAASFLPLVAIAEIASGPAKQIGEAVGAQQPSITDLMTIAAAQRAATSAGVADTAAHLATIAAGIHSEGLQHGLDRLVAERTAREVALSRSSERGSAQLIAARVDNGTATINRKKWSISVAVNSSVSVRDVQGQLALAARYGVTRSAL